LGAQPVLCVAGRGPFDDAVARMLIQLLEKHGLGGCVETNAAVSASNIVRLNSAGVMVVCLSYLDLGSSAAHLRHSIKRIRRQIAGATLVAGLWGHAGDENREQLQTTAAADYYVSSLREALSLCIDAVSGHLPKLPATRNAESATTAASLLRARQIMPRILQGNTQILTRSILATVFTGC
jgi:hypothetical protein